MVLRPVPDFVTYVEAKAKGLDARPLAEAARQDEVGVLAQKGGGLVAQTED